MFLTKGKKKGSIIVKLGDFGIAKDLKTQGDFAKTFLWTPYFMSPGKYNNFCNKLLFRGYKRRSVWIKGRYLGNRMCFVWNGVSSKAILAWVALSFVWFDKNKRTLTSSPRYWWKY